MRRTLLLITTVATLSATTATARADGARIDSRKTTAEVVAESRIIATAKVVAVKHDWATRRAYGQDHRYVRRYSVKVVIDGFVRGEHRFDLDHRGKRRFWVDGRAHGVPGKWVIIENYYGSDQVFSRLRRGDRFVLYLRSSYADKGHLSASEIDEVKALANVRSLVDAASLEARKKARAAAVAAKQALTCEDLDTYKRGEACQSPEALRAAHVCPRGRTARIDLADSGKLLLSCGDRRGRRDGPFVEFRALGSVRREGRYRRDKLHGAVVDRDAAGEAERATCYRDGAERWKVDGPIPADRRCP